MSFFLVKTLCFLLIFPCLPLPLPLTVYGNPIIILFGEFTTHRHSNHSCRKTETWKLKVKCGFNKQSSKEWKGNKTTKEVIKQQKQIEKKWTVKRYEVSERIKMFHRNNFFNACICNTIRDALEPLTAKLNLLYSSLLSNDFCLFSLSSPPSFTDNLFLPLLRLPIFYHLSSSSHCLFYFPFDCICSPSPSSLHLNRN